MNRPGIKFWIRLRGQGHSCQEITLGILTSLERFHVNLIVSRTAYENEQYPIRFNIKYSAFAYYFSFHYSTFLLLSLMEW